MTEPLNYIWWPSTARLLSAECGGLIKNGRKFMGKTKVFPTNVRRPNYLLTYINQIQVCNGYLLSVTATTPSITDCPSLLDRQSSTAHRLSSTVTSEPVILIQEQGSTLRSCSVLWRITMFQSRYWQETTGLQRCMNATWPADSTKWWDCGFQQSGTWALIKCEVKKVVQIFSVLFHMQPLFRSFETSFRTFAELFDCGYV